MTTDREVFRNCYKSIYNTNPLLSKWSDEMIVEWMDWYTRIGVNLDPKNVDEYEYCTNLIKARVRYHERLRDAEAEHNYYKLFG